MTLEEMPELVRRAFSIMRSRKFCQTMQLDQSFHKKTFTTQRPDELEAVAQRRAPDPMIPFFTLQKYKR